MSSSSPTRAVPKSAALTCLLFLLLTSPGQAEPAASVRSERFLHACAGAAAALLVEAVAYPLVEGQTERQTALLLTGLGVSGSFLAGVCKELLDLIGFGEPEWQDLLFTVIGGLAASSLAAVLTSLRPYTGAESLGISGALAAFGVVLSIPVAEGLYRRIIPSSEPQS